MLSMENEDWIYDAELIRVVDGDTIRFKLFVDVDFGFRFTQRLFFEDNFRIKAIDAPELRGDEKVLGQLSKAWTEEWLKDKKIVVRSHKHGKYRWVAEVYADGMDFSEEIVKAGHAVWI